MTEWKSIITTPTSESHIIAWVYAIKPVIPHVIIQVIKYTVFRIRATEPFRTFVAVIDGY